MVERRFPATLRRVAGAVAMAVACLSSTSLLAADCDIPSDLVLSDGYLVGRELLALPDEALASYIIGFINATSLSVAFGAEQACIEQAHKCLAHVGTDQVGTALRRYISGNPDRLEQPASHLTFQVMYSRCVRIVEKGQPT